MLTRETIINRLRENHSFLHDEYGVKRIGLFGSFAKEAADENSDVDVVVEFERPIGFKFIELVDYLETLFEKEVDVLTLTGIQSIRVGKVAENISQSVVYV